jgi:hypothetical protein
VLTKLTSRAPGLMAELRKLWWLLDVNDITIRAKYIRSAANVWADKLSRETAGRADWALRRPLFRQLDSEWGPHSIDRFAATNNALLKRFNALADGPGCEAVDALVQTDEQWRAEVNWCHPPWQLLGQVASKLDVSGAAATVVAPTWRSSPWYAQLLGLCSELRVEPARTDTFDKTGALHLRAPTSLTFFRIPRRAQA